MAFELTLSLGDIVAVLSISIVLFGFLWKIQQIFNKFCNEITLVKFEMRELEQRQKLSEKIHNDMHGDKS